MTIHSQPGGFEVTIREESIPRSEVAEMLLKLSSAKLTAGQLISERVRAECDRRLFDLRGKPAPKLVTPNEKERALNRPGMRRSVNPDRQVQIALSAFEANGFILLIDDRQVEDIREELEIREDTVVTFLKLTPLVGG